MPVNTEIRETSMQHNLLQNELYATMTECSDSLRYEIECLSRFVAELKFWKIREWETILEFVTKETLRRI